MLETMLNKYPHFAEVEFTRCNPPCKLSDMQESFMNRLETARIIAGIPFVLNSAYRTREYEISRGRAGGSSHCKGRAVDISCIGTRNRQIMVSALIKAGFTRIGIAKTFIHVDYDTDKTDALWLY